MSTVQKLWQNKKFGSLTSIFGYNFTQNLRNIEFSQTKRLSYLLELFSGTSWRNLRRILGTDFPQSPKNCQKWPKMAFFSHKWVVFEKRAKISKKSVRATFLTFFTPNFVPSFGKILVAVSEIIRDGRRTAHRPDFIGPFRFSTGDQ